MTHASNEEESEPVVNATGLATTRRRLGPREEPRALRTHAVVDVVPVSSRVRGNSDVRRTRHARAPTRDGGALRIAIEDIVAEVVDARLVGRSAFPWITLREAGLTPKVARTLHRREGVRLTRIGKALRIHRDDLEALAARNALDDAQATEDVRSVDELADVDPSVRAAFMRAARGR